MDKQIIIDEERTFECVWCKYDFKESDAHFILSENPNECVCSNCITEWADNLLCDLKRKEQECKNLREDIKDIANLLDLDTGEEYNFENIKLEIKQLKAYRSVLEEIREDLETQIYCECSECGNDDYSECVECMSKRYLQKINESEVNNDR